MTKDEFMRFHDFFTGRMKLICEEKNKDYTGQSADPFHNFTRVEALGIASTEQGMLTRMTDKLARVGSFLQRGELTVKDESVQDTLIDLANYSALLAGYLRMKADGRGKAYAPPPLENVGADPLNLSIREVTK